MTFGEKLQTLRKAGGLSQDQLAAQLQVSRQAISKWELGESMPDTDNVVKLCRVLQCSTDYLLLEEAALQPSVEKGASRRAAAFPVGLTAVLIGLLVSIAGWRTWQTPFSVVAGVIVQLVGLAAYELLGGNCRARLYTASCWFLAPVPTAALWAAAVGVYPKLVPTVFSLVIPGMIYLFLCAAITLALRHRRKK